MTDDAPGNVPVQDTLPQTTRRRRGRSTALVAALVAGGILVVAGLTAGGMTLFNAYAAQPPTAPAAPAAAAATVPPGAVNTSGFPSGGANPGIFTDTCKHTFTAANDPILMPGMTGSSMQHDFFGNLASTSSSTPATLVGGSTNCSTAADASAYWTPVLFQNGKALTPSATLIYWRATAGTAASVKTMPAGISIVAGDETGSAAQSPRVVGWTCSGTLAVPMKLASAPATCAAGHYLRLVVTFPNCWDGRTLDGATQKNVIYPTAMKTCPSSHPVQIPQIVVHINYPTSNADNLTLSVGPSQQGSLFTAHADFMNGWTQPAMDRNVAACIATQTRCGPVTDALATPKGPRV